MSREEAPFPFSYVIGFLLRIALLSALSCSLGLWILWWAFSQQLGSEFAPAFHTLRGLLRLLPLALAVCALAVFVVASIGVFVTAVLASHKVAGPLFRLQRVAGHLERRVLVGAIHLREGDHVRPLADAVDAWVVSRKSRLSRLRAEAEACGVALRGCEAALSGARLETEDFLERMLALRRCAGELRRS